MASVSFALNEICEKQTQHRSKRQKIYYSSHRTQKFMITKRIKKNAENSR